MQICVSGLENLRLSNYPAGMSILSENIKSLRSKFANQTEFGEQIGVGQSTIVRWEKGADPKPDNLLSLARIADVTIEQLITMPLTQIPALRAGDGLPSEDDFRRMISDAMQEVPPGTPLSGYPPIVASSLRDRLALLLKHGASPDSSAEAIVPGTVVQSPAPTKAGGQGERRNP